jgi:hypothetical protein
LFNTKGSNCSAIQLRERVGFWRDVGICFFLLNQHTELNFIMLDHWNKNQHVVPLVHIIMIPSNFILFMVWPSRGLKPRSGALDELNPAITLTTRFKYQYIVWKKKINDMMVILRRAFHFMQILNCNKNNWSILSLLRTFSYNSSQVCCNMHKLF